MGKVRVLLVEDHLMVQKLASMMFDPLSCILEIANNGAAAIARGGEYEYDLIILDLGLPDMDGLAVAKKIRQENSKNQHTPIIALTAHSEDEVKEQIKANGLDGCFSKPFTLEMVKKMLKYAKKSN